MHEVSIAHSIIQTVLDEKKKNDWAGIRAIGLKIGALSGILPDALAFGFDALKKDTPLESCHLEIEETPVVARCRACAHRFEVEELTFTCPRCASTSLDVEQGQEMLIAYMEVDEIKDTTHDP